MESSSVTGERFQSECLTDGNLQFIVNFYFNLQKEPPNQYFGRRGRKDGRERMTPGLVQDASGQGRRNLWNFKWRSLEHGQGNAREEEALGKGDN